MTKMPHAFMYYTGMDGGARMARPLVDRCTVFAIQTDTQSPPFAVAPVQPCCSCCFGSLSAGREGHPVLRDTTRTHNKRRLTYDHLAGASHRTCTAGRTGADVRHPHVLQKALRCLWPVANLEPCLLTLAQAEPVATFVVPSQSGHINSGENKATDEQQCRVEVRQVPCVYPNVERR